jgi:hypothetical protein
MSDADELDKIEKALTLSLEGNWKAAHALIDDMDHPIACWLHASLHREEGDLGNARYWYGQARKAISADPFEVERKVIQDAFRKSRAVI